jgi:predicted nucleic acid-binding Zn finger protein
MKQQLVESNKSLKKYRKSGKGRVIALSRRIYRLMQTDVFYVESEWTDNLYYFVKFKPDVIEWCSCPDNSMRGMKCKHLFGVEYATRLATVKDVDKLPEQVKREVTKSYTEDDYSF